MFLSDRKVGIYAMDSIMSGRTFFASVLVAGLFVMDSLPVWSQQHSTAKEPPMKASAKAKAATRFVPTPWNVRCASGKAGKVRCALGRAIIEARSRNIFVSVEIPDHRKFMSLRLPHGLDLRSSVEVAVDGKPIGKAAYVTSRTNGAFARLPLDKKALAAMSKGEKLVVKMRIFGGRAMSVVMDLQGFSAALKKM